jgi:hypothetical protein
MRGAACMLWTDYRSSNRPKPLSRNEGLYWQQKMRGFIFEKNVTKRRKR